MLEKLKDNLRPVGKEPEHTVVQSMDLEEILAVSSLAKQAAMLLAAKAHARRPKPEWEESGRLIVLEGILLEDHRHINSAWESLRAVGVSRDMFPVDLEVPSNNDLSHEAVSANIL